MSVQAKGWNSLSCSHVFICSCQAAFDKLDSIYGTYTEKSDVKSNFQLPRHCMTNTDLNRIINSDEVRWLFAVAVGPGVPI